MKKFNNNKKIISVDTRGISIGDKMLRRNYNYPDEPEQWVVFIVNKTYIELISEFPDDYRFLDGKTLDMIVTV